MGEHAFQDIVKSTFILEDGGRIIKWWCWQLFEWGTSWAWWLEVNGGESRIILGPIVGKKKDRNRKNERA
jgi:hypothetical protein